jgi:hypothetical protein
MTVRGGFPVRFQTGALKPDIRLTPRGHATNAAGALIEPLLPLEPSISSPSNDTRRLPSWKS